MTRSRRLGVVLALNVVLIAALVGVGLRAHSLGVIAASADYLADAAAICMSLYAMRLSRRATAAGASSRATTIAAMVNAGWLFLLCALVIGDGITRLATGVGPIEGVPVMIVGGMAAVLMLGGALILAGDDAAGDDDVGAALNMRAVLLDTAADAAAAAGVAITGLAVSLTNGLYWLDPAIAIVIAAVVGFHAVQLLHDVRRELCRRRYGAPPARARTPRP